MGRRKIVTEEIMQEICRMRYEQGMPIKAIAEKLDLNDGTVSTYVSLPENRQKYRDIILKKWQENTATMQRAEDMQKAGYSESQVFQETGITYATLRLAKDRKRKTGHFYQPPTSLFDEKERIPDDVKRVKAYVIRNKRTGTLAAETVENCLRIKIFSEEQAAAYMKKRLLNPDVFVMERYGVMHVPVETEEIHHE